MSSHMLNSYLSLSHKLYKQGLSEQLNDPSYYDIWLCPHGISLSGKNYNECKNNINATLATMTATFPKDGMTYLGILGNQHIECNGDDGMHLEKTYQEIYNIPVSAYLFSNKECCSDTFQLDSCYTAFNYNVYKQRLYYNAVGDDYFTKGGADGPGKHWPNKQKHFNSIYNFASGYNSSEYYRYDGPTDYMLGDNVSMMADNVSLSSDIHNATGGGLLITWYSGNRSSEVDKMVSAYPVDAFTNGKAAIPCIYYELPLNYKLNNAIVNIQWSENGLYIFS